MGQKSLITVILLFSGLCIRAQIADSAHILLQKDSMPFIEMDEIVVTSEEGFDHPFAPSYNKLKHDVYTVYPYAQMAAYKLEKIDSTLQTLPNEWAREQYLNEQEKQLKSRYKEPLKDLTISQGKILLLLIYRETEASCYYLIKEFKSGLNARFWQTVGYVFGYNLKRDYDPSDYPYIERILRDLEQKSE